MRDIEKWGDAPGKDKWNMVSKAKTVGQLLSALTKAIAESSPNTTVSVTWADGNYTVKAGAHEATADKLYNAICRVGKAFLGAPAENSARERLRARLGGETFEAAEDSDF